MPNGEKGVKNDYLSSAGHGSSAPLQGECSRAPSLATAPASAAIRPRVEPESTRGSNHGPIPPAAPVPTVMSTADGRPGRRSDVMFMLFHAMGIGGTWAIVLGIAAMVGLRAAMRGMGSGRRNSRKRGGW
jgi:hypothetical protein